MSSVTDGLLYKGVGEEESVDDDEAEASEGVEAESKHCECPQYGQQDKEQQKTKLGMRNNLQISSIILSLCVC